jgi:hypothetical protein
MNKTSRLNKLISRKKLSGLADRRLARDLEAVCQRLEKNEYETSGIVKNVFDMAEQSRVLYAHLKTYARIGDAWSEIFKILPIKRFAEILDICPGFAPKIEIGLFYRGYKGRVVVLDKQKAAVTNLKKIMSLFRPDFEIVPYARNLFFPARKKFRMVAGNHVFDDLILEYFCEKNRIDSRNIYEKEGRFVKVWGMILRQNRDFEDELVDKFSGVFRSLTEKGGYLCLAQYKSYMEKMLSLDNSYSFTRKIFRKVITNLLRNGFLKLQIDEKIFKQKDKYFNQGDFAILKRIR